MLLHILNLRIHPALVVHCHDQQFIRTGSLPHVKHNLRLIRSGGDHTLRYRVIHLLKCCIKRHLLKNGFGKRIYV